MSAEASSSANQQDNVGGHGDNYPATGGTAEKQPDARDLIQFAAATFQDFVPEGLQTALCVKLS